MLLRRHIKDGALTGPVHIIASPFKTGTTSVGEAIVALGVGERMMPYRHRLTRDFLAVARPLNRLVVKGEGFAAFSAKHEAHIREVMAPVLPLIAKFDVFHDAPFGHNHLHPFVRKIVAPQARFIWVNRPEESWLSSVRRWEESHPDTYPNHARWTKNPQAAKEDRLKAWRKAYSGFKRVRRNDPSVCLELQWSDLGSFDALARFYGVEAPQEAFPRSNVGLP